MNKTQKIINDYKRKITGEIDKDIVNFYVLNKVKMHIEERNITVNIDFYNDIEKFISELIDYIELRNCCYDNNFIIKLSAVISQYIIFQLITLVSSNKYEERFMYLLTEHLHELKKLLLQFKIEIDNADLINLYSTFNKYQVPAVKIKKYLEISFLS